MFDPEPAHHVPPHPAAPKDDEAAVGPKYLAAISLRTRPKQNNKRFGLGERLGETGFFQRHRQADRRLPTPTGPLLLSNHLVSASVRAVVALFSTVADGPGDHDRGMKMGRGKR